MTRSSAALVLTALLAACGADGEPRPPEDEPRSDIRVSGSAAVGISVSSGKVRPHGGVAVSNGPFTVHLGL